MQQAKQVYDALKRSHAALTAEVDDWSKKYATLNASLESKVQEHKVKMEELERSNSELIEAKIAVR